MLRVEPPALLSYEFFPRVSGLPDVPASYSTVTMSPGHKHVAFYWRGTLPVLRDLIEGRPSATLTLASSRKI